MYVMMMLVYLVGVYSNKMNPISKYLSIVYIDEYNYHQRTSKYNI